MHIFRSNDVLFHVFGLFLLQSVPVLSRCDIPIVIQGSWFSVEKGENTVTEIKADTMSRRGRCEAMTEEYHVNYTFVFQSEEDERCFSCVKIIVRSVNVLEKIETECAYLQSGEQPTVEKVCSDLSPDKPLTTLFSEVYAPVNCKSSLEGVWMFAYQSPVRFKGECNQQENRISSCHYSTGTPVIAVNQKMNITYKACQGMPGTLNGVVEYSCLGDWFVDKNHFFAVANTKESRKDEKYRCFLRNRDDDLYFGASITAECNTLKTVEQSPERYRVTPVKAEVVEAGCTLPQNFSGEWINTANIDADIVINQTHIIETYYMDQSRYRRVVYVCKEVVDDRYMMARINDNGCSADHICFEFAPKHHNVIRYRKGRASHKQDHYSVCSLHQFPSKMRCDTFLAKTPVPIRCPIAGYFNFTQRGDAPFETRIQRGITLPPRPGSCQQTISALSVCGKEKNEITIDARLCRFNTYSEFQDVPKNNNPISYNDVSGDPDYRLKCIGFWKENLKSYLVTYDELDPFSKYRCWVYQRADLNRVLMSQAIGAFCDIGQDVTSWNYTEGASVAIEMQEYGVEYGVCPMHFDDGSDPWFSTAQNSRVSPSTPISTSVTIATPFERTTEFPSHRDLL